MQIYDRFKYRQSGLVQSLLHKFGSAATQLKKTLTDYPVYAPPNQGVAAMLTPEQAQANQVYFYQEKSRRLTLIKNLLQSFDITLNTNNPNEHALMQMDAWAYQQWPAVYHPSLVTSHVYSFNFAGSETQVRSMLFDVGLALGECYLSLTEGARWFLDTSELSAAEQRPSVNRMVILLPPKPGQSEGWHDVLDMEAQVFYHYSLQTKAQPLLAVDQKTGRVLAEPVLKRLSEVAVRPG